MYVFHGEIGCDQELAARRQLENGAVVANALYDRAGSGGRPGQLPDSRNQSPFSHNVAMAA
jgi:hypothetical protein